MSTGLRIGEVAAVAGVNIQTLRYYERRGLLAVPNRSLGGIGSTHSRRWRHCGSSRPRNGSGSHSTKSPTCCTSPRNTRAPILACTRAVAKLAEVDAKLLELTAVRDTLRAALAAGCDDLLACSESPCCPVPFDGDLASVPAGRGGCGC